jgi:hypothetical protein
VKVGCLRMSGIPASIDAPILQAYIGCRPIPEVQPSRKSTAGRGYPVYPENSFTLALCFQFRIISEYPFHVEWKAPFRGEISRDSGQPSHTVMKGHEAGNTGL